MSFTHKDLCDLAVTWLKRPSSRGGPGCCVAFSEVRADWTGETPDAIGFRAGVYNEASVVIEAKTSRADFLADAKKPHRQHPETGMGVYRYFIAPQGLLQVAELPAGWGLLEVTARGVVKVAAGHVQLKRDEPDVWRQTRALDAEWTLLARILNRVADPEKVQLWLKEARNRNTALARSNDALRQQNEELRRKLLRAEFARQ